MMHSQQNFKFFSYQIKQFHWCKVLFLQSDTKELAVILVHEAAITV
jgi:hypothetical protein